MAEEVLNMCGIVGAIAQRPIADILLTGLKSLEYRGYDSAGICFITSSEKALAREHDLEHIKTCPNEKFAYALYKKAGKVAALEQVIKEHDADGKLGIAHTRWATHGKPSETNAHPHICGRIALVHNGIIENFAELKSRLISQGETFYSQTDTEVVAVLINSFVKQGMSTLEAFKAAISQMQGSFAFAMLDLHEPDHMYLAKRGSPLVIGLGIGENFAASDVLALLPVTSRFIYLEDGDMARLSLNQVEIWDKNFVLVERDEQHLQLSADTLSKGKYKHFMQKEIFEQPEAIERTLSGRVEVDDISDQAFLANPFFTQEQDLKKSAQELFHSTHASGHIQHAVTTSSDNEDSKMPLLFKDCLKQIDHVEIVACGTSYHAGLVGKYFLEEYAQVSTNVTIASEYRYKRTIVPPRSLFVTLSQSGETADTLAALKLAKTQGYAHTLCICNVANSSLVRESEYMFLTLAGAEIGVASTKAFTTQLLALDLLTIALGRAHNTLSKEQARGMIHELAQAPNVMRQVLEQEHFIESLASEFAGKEHALFLGRGPMYPIALEGALKLKEISYIHAEGYASGELKHGPIALIDAKMPVVVVAPDNQWLPKLLSNIEEVRARGGRLYVFAGSSMKSELEHGQFMEIKNVNSFVEPIVFTLPLQMLAYHVAVINGTDVDQPRNLAKSVTVE